MNYNKVINKKLGFYTVFDPINPAAYSSKVEALLHATKANTWIEWNFNEDVFRKVDWTQEPKETLQELYRQRALQLRDNYDYLILNYSGGSDSKNILDTFLNNNIHIDEILVRWPNKASKNVYTPNAYDYVPENVFSEWDLVIVPDLQQIAAQHPEIKITCWDVSEEVKTIYKDIDWIVKGSGEHLCPGHIVRYSMGMDIHKNILDKGRKVAHIHGIDKPRIAHENGKFYAFFIDSVANLSSMIYDDSVNEENVQEQFYWTPDFPKLIVKQSHIVAKFFKEHPAFLYMIRKGFVPYTIRTAYEMIIKSLIYPTWDSSRFQAAKPTSSFFCEYDQWFWDSYKDTSTLEVWQKGIDYTVENIDSKYFSLNRNGDPSSFVGCVSTHFDLGI